MRPNENCVDRITDSIISVSRTMTEPVRFRYAASHTPSHDPSEPPVSNVLLPMSVAGNARLMNEQAHAKKTVTPVTFVYGASGFSHQK